MLEAIRALPKDGALPAKVHHQLLLVLPFDNRTAQPNLDWIGEAVSETFNQRSGASGRLPDHVTTAFFGFA